MGSEGSICQTSICIYCSAYLVCILEVDALNDDHRNGQNRNLNMLFVGMFDM